MTIANASTILATDLNTANDAAATSLASAHTSVLVPHLYWLNLDWVGLVNTTTEIYRTRTITLPDDYHLVEISVAGGEHDGYVTVAVDNGALIETILVTDTLVSPGYDYAPRWWTANPQAPAQLLLKGSILTVTVTTTDTLASSTLRVSLGLASPWRRT